MLAGAGQRITTIGSPPQIMARDKKHGAGADGRSAPRAERSPAAELLTNVELLIDAATAQLTNTCSGAGQQQQGAAVRERLELCSRLKGAEPEAHAGA